MSVARQQILNKNRRSLLGNGTHVPPATDKHTRMNDSVSAGPAEGLKDILGNPLSPVWEAVKRGLESVKLKNLHC
jgi:hypothetical protein